MIKTSRTFILTALSLLLINAGSCSQSGEQKEAGDTPFRFGIIADVQYADMDNRRTGTPREVFHRDVVNVLKEFVDSANKLKPRFVIQLGDLIEGHRHGDRSAREPELAQKDLNTVLEIIDCLQMDVYHVVGNHCLPAGEVALLEMLNRERFYYDFYFDEAPGWRFLVLDGNDEGEGLMGEEQIKWLRSQLSGARENRERVICFSHYPLIGEVGETQGLKILDEFEPAVVAWMSGHRHTGNYTIRNGVHHITFKGMVENPVENAYAMVELHPDMIRIKGFGAEQDRNLELPVIHQE